MDGLAPPYHFVLDLIYELESGGSVRIAVRRYTSQFQGAFADALKGWLIKQQGLSPENKTGHNSSYQQAIFDLLDLSSQGGSILLPLYELEKEIRFACEEQLERHLSALPYKMMVPLLLFQFPALLLLLLGPLLGQLLKEFSQ